MFAAVKPSYGIIVMNTIDMTGLSRGRGSELLLSACCSENRVKFSARRHLIFNLAL